MAHEPVDAPIVKLFVAESEARERGLIVGDIVRCRAYSAEPLLLSSQLCEHVHADVRTCDLTQVRATTYVTDGVQHDGWKMALPIGEDPELHSSRAHYAS